MRPGSRTDSVEPMTALHLPNTESDAVFWSKVEGFVRTLPPNVADQQRLYNIHRYLNGGATPRVLTANTLPALAVLHRIRRSTRHPLLLLKGLQVGSLYPQLWMRDLGDIDILTTAPDDVYRDLVGVGFEPRNIANIKTHHQLPPLWNHEFHLSVEVHRRPNTGQFPQFVTPEQVFAESTESRVEIEGIRGPSVEHEFSLHLAHSWSDRPIGRARDIIDLTLLAGALQRQTAAETARSYHLNRVWKATVQARSALLENEGASLVLRRATRHLTQPFDPRHDVYRRLASPLWADSPRHGFNLLRRELLRAANGNPGESVLHKFKRSVA